MCVCVWCVCACVRACVCVCVCVCVRVCVCVMPELSRTTETLMVFCIEGNSLLNWHMFFPTARRDRIKNSPSDVASAELVSFQFQTKLSNCWFDGRKQNTKCETHGQTVSCASAFVLETTFGKVLAPFLGSAFADRYTLRFRHVWQSTRLFRRSWAAGQILNWFFILPFVGKL